MNCSSSTSRVLASLVGAALVIVACGDNGKSSATGPNADGGADGSAGGGGADGGSGEAGASACAALGGFCLPACAGTFKVASTTACGGSDFCCVDTTQNGTDAGTCTGTAPLCFGADVTMCCGHDPAGSAQCIGGAWKCGSAAAPGCNGQSCTAPADAGGD